MKKLIITLAATLSFATTIQAQTLVGITLNLTGSAEGGNITYNGVPYGAASVYSSAGVPNYTDSVAGGADLGVDAGGAWFISALQPTIQGTATLNYAYYATADVLNTVLNGVSTATATCQTISITPPAQTTPANKEVFFTAISPKSYSLSPSDFTWSSFGAVWYIYCDILTVSLSASGSVSHPHNQGGKDDYANSAAALLVVATLLNNNLVITTH